MPWPVVTAALILALVGLLDDWLTISAAPRLAAQVLTGAMLGLDLGGVPLALLGAVLMPVVVNIVNFMDGINGITALTLTVWAGTAIYAGLANDVPAVAFTGALTLGSALGFLPWNAPRARMFLGDVGSYLFGALAAGGVLVGVTNEVPIVLLTAPLVLYVADTGITLARRALRGAPLMEAHREHVYQRLVSDCAVPHISVSAALALLALVCVTAWASPFSWLGLTATTLIIILYINSVALLRRFRTSTPSQAGR
ncbi:hypothetical protein V2J56_15060 [Georgenia sp. MJ206]|uniref:hypothetical protein n=1 Tax=Georgenia wangjunii TaxID=3117730 RepID=UPI002F261579